MKYEGTVVRVEPTQEISEKFKKRELILTDEAPKYPQFIGFTFTQKNVGLLDALNEGDQVEVTFSLRGREWTSPKTGELKVFNTLDAFKVEKKARPVAPEPFEPTPDDDLPF